MLNKVLLDLCSLFNFLNFPSSQKWNKYQKGSGSRVLVFLQEFWNPCYSGILVRSQKIEATTQFFLKKVTYSQLSPTFTETETIFVASPRPVFCVLVSHNLRPNVPYFTSPSPILEAPESVIPLPESHVSVKWVTTSLSPCLIRDLMTTTATSKSNRFS